LTSWKSPHPQPHSNLFYSLLINAKEERDAAVIDIPNAFIQTRLERDSNKAIMRLCGKLAELMVKVAPKIYTKYVIINAKGETMLYVRLLNALYGIMRGALLYYQKFVKNLHTVGFEVNPYDPCVANKIVQGTQLIIIWHVDDLKVSHRKASVVTKMANCFSVPINASFTTALVKCKLPEAKSMSTLA
jgi:hypothetical protein